MDNEYTRFEIEVIRFEIELIRIAKLLGLNSADSNKIVKATVKGTIALLKIMTPQEIISKVASPGGTTEAGLKVLRDGGTLEEAVRAAVKRAEELQYND